MTSSLWLDIMVRSAAPLLEHVAPDPDMPSGQSLRRIPWERSLTPQEPYSLAIPLTPRACANLNSSSSPCFETGCQAHFMIRLIWRNQRSTFGNSLRPIYHGTAAI